jgi:hypothetical protein
MEGGSVEPSGFILPERSPPDGYGYWGWGCCSAGGTTATGASQSIFYHPCASTLLLSILSSPAIFFLKKSSPFLFLFYDERYFMRKTGPDHDDGVLFMIYETISAKNRDMQTIPSRKGGRPPAVEHSPRALPRGSWAPACSRMPSVGKEVAVEKEGGR